jgi:hypothetical protein
MARAWARWRPVATVMLACCGAAAGYAAARAEGSTPGTPRPARPADARIWSKLEEAAAKQPAAGARRAVAVAEVGFYPRNAAEAEAFAGRALLLVTTLAARIDDAAITGARLHIDDGREGDLVVVAAQTNDVDTNAHPAARLVGPYRHDALFYVPVWATESRAHVTASFAGRQEVVLRFPRAAPASLTKPTAAKESASSNLADVARIGGAIYPFFRVPPFRSPGMEATCPYHEPEPGSLPPPSPAEQADAKTRLNRSARSLAGKARARGALDKEDIRRIIRAHTSEVQSCYERELNETPKLSARVMVRFTIAGDGWVVASALQETDTDNQRLTTCMVGLVRCWRFPKPIGGGIVIVSYPWVLTPEPDPK